MDGEHLHDLLAIALEHRSRRLARGPAFQRIRR
jgi:hypothetical protein